MDSSSSRPQYSWRAAYTWSASNLAMWPVAKCSLFLPISLSWVFGGCQFGLSRLWRNNIDYVWSRQVLLPVSPSEPFMCVNGASRPHLHGFIPLTPRLPAASLWKRWELDLSRVNTSNYRVPVQPWKEPSRTRMENQSDDYQLLKMVFVGMCVWAHTVDSTVS